MEGWNLTRGRVLNVLGIEHGEHGDLIPKWKESAIIVIYQFGIGVLDLVDIIKEFLAREDLVGGVTNNGWVY